MSGTETGVYIDLLALQADTDYLPEDFEDIARLLGGKYDRRTVRKFLERYADVSGNYGKSLETSGKLRNFSGLFPRLPEDFGKRANAKLLELQVKSGKIASPKNTEENRGEEKRGEQNYSVGGSVPSQVTDAEVVVEEPSDSPSVEESKPWKARPPRPKNPASGVGTFVPDLTQKPSGAPPNPEVEVLCKKVASLLGKSVHPSWAVHAERLLSKTPLDEAIAIAQWALAETPNPFWREHTFNMKNLADHIATGDIVEQRNSWLKKQDVNKRLTPVGEDRSQSEYRDTTKYSSKACCDCHEEFSYEWFQTGNVRCEACLEKAKAELAAEETV
jgi:hypothetical protein